MFPRLLPADFNMKSEHGRGLDWPFSYNDLAPYYDRVAQDIGISGDAKAEERWRPSWSTVSDATDKKFSARRRMAKKGSKP